MKTFKFLLLVVISFFTISCSVDIEDPLIISNYMGSWNGAYTGVEDSGVWEMHVDKEGNIKGFTKSDVLEETFLVKGIVYNNGELFVSVGTVSGGAIFTGEMSGNTGKGSWINEVAGFSGEWTGDKAIIPTQ